MKGNYDRLNKSYENVLNAVTKESDIVYQSALEDRDNAFIRVEVKRDVYFRNPTSEYKYFIRRIEAINNYSNEFFKERAIENLVLRYVKALATIIDNPEASLLVDVYKDCLVMLGMDDYVINGEVEDYRETHEISSDVVFVSENGRSNNELLSSKGRTLK